MPYCRLIAPEWLKSSDSAVKKVLEGEFSVNAIKEYNEIGYNVYYFPNHPKEYKTGTPVDGTQVTVFSSVFVDYDCKTSTYDSKDHFIEAIGTSGIMPSSIVDSGNGIHAYWNVSDLDATSYLRLSRRLTRLFNTDEAVGKICQLMRLPGTINTKDKNNLVKCELLFESDTIYTCEELDKVLPPITQADEQYCQNHYNKTHDIADTNTIVDEAIPSRFGKLIRQNHEVKELWANSSEDRSKSDYRLGHIMFANGFSKEEATSVLINSAKALTRTFQHRVNYASNIVDKIWTFELATEDSELKLSSSVEDILSRSGSTLKGTQFRCHKRIDNTEHGFRLGQVIGLVAGSGVGKTAFALNMFKWFIEENPDYNHFFIPLEQPANEIADRWKTMCGDDTTLNKKVHIISNYDDDGNFRHLSFDEIKDYVLKWQKVTGKKVGCIVIDHIGALKKKGSNDENQDLMTICHNMKAFAVQTNTLLVMQSQTSREKAGIGDLELSKDAAYGTLFFEAYCDYLITLWQPLKRCHSEQSCPTVMAFKFCKIRHKKAKKDIIKEDVPYFFYFDSDRETLRDMTQDEETSFKYFLPKATNKRKADRKTELVEYKSVPYKEGDTIAIASANSDRQSTRH